MFKCVVGADQSHQTSDLKNKEIRVDKLPPALVVSRERRRLLLLLVVVGVLEM